MNNKYHTITEALGKINEHTPMSKKTIYNKIALGLITTVGRSYQRKIHIDEINRYLKDNYLL
jgi:hypothetical protein